MTPKIRQFLESQGNIICPNCNGEGEYETFCGHYTSETCYMCQGAGMVRSLNKQKHSKKCIICHGRKGGCGGCNNHPKGLIEWESYELL